MYTNRINMVYYSKISVLVWDYFGTIFQLLFLRARPEPTHTLPKFSQIFGICFTLQSPLVGGFNSFQALAVLVGVVCLAIDV